MPNAADPCRVGISGGFGEPGPDARMIPAGEREGCPLLDRRGARGVERRVLRSADRGPLSTVTLTAEDTFLG